MKTHRIVVKLGTSLLTSNGEHLDLEVMNDLVRQIAALYNEGHELVIVSSGAITAGRLKLKDSSRHRGVLFKQVLASIGQSYLMNTYERLFSDHDITIAQALLTKSDICERAGYLNARNVLHALMELRIIGIINENDVVAFDEIAESRFGDNDNLSSMVANLIDADILILLTDIDGLYTADPRSNSGVELIKIVDQIDESIERLAGEASTTEGTGGMITKIEAAKLATASGVDVIIANGRAEDILLKIGHGEQAGTFFKSQMNKLESRKRWMLAGLALKGKLFVDSGACTAIIKRHKSLLPAGIVKVQGNFQRGDIVEVLTQDSEHIASGISNYSSDEINSIRGVASNRIAALLGHEYGTEVIHRNNMVVIYSK